MKAEKDPIADFTYYERESAPKQQKADIVKAFVAKHDDIKTVYDVGCNNANISYPLQRDLGKSVLGVDASDELILPPDYMFKKEDILCSREIYASDCTLFLSVYHHILGMNDIYVADTLFYKLLARTKYLLFDSGNMSEKNRVAKYWYVKQKEYFKSEDELLGHFGVGYNVLGTWSAGGGIRSVVVFENRNKSC